MKLWLMLFAYFLPMLGWAGVPPRTLDSTAAYLVLAQDRLADLTDAKVQRQVQTMKTEVEFVFDQVLTDVGRQAFYQSMPWVPGMILLGLTPELESALKALPHDGNKIDLKVRPTGIAALDAANAKAGATALVRGQFRGYTVEIPADHNAARAALAYQGVPGIRYAEPNAVLRMGGLQPLQRFAARPTLYVFSVGWGDCMAGCMFQHRWYFEVSGTHSVRKIAEAGSPLQTTDSGADPKTFFK